ncbi:MAG TPA: hypothetical protein VIY08_14260 [Candidatus Nitrosocosmicus sp.]
MFCSFSIGSESSPVALWIILPISFRDICTSFAICLVDFLSFDNCDLHPENGQRKEE